MATAIAKDISSTTIKLGKLGQRMYSCRAARLFGLSEQQQLQSARRSSTTGQSRSVYALKNVLKTLGLTEHCSQELTYIIKQDIANLNKQIASLQTYVKQRGAQGGSKTHESKLIEEHQHNVVMLLQSKLADISMTFKDVLEIRTQVSRLISVRAPPF